LAIINPVIPPYFLSNNELSIQSEKIDSLNKGRWDKSEDFESRF
jgi:site-specific DNA-methyltransferase (adenine-specific)